MLLFAHPEYPTKETPYPCGYPTTTITWTPTVSGGSVGEADPPDTVGGQVLSSRISIRVCWIPCWIVRGCVLTPGGVARVGEFCPRQLEGGVFSRPSSVAEEGAAGAEVSIKLLLLAARRAAILPERQLSCLKGSFPACKAGFLPLRQPYCLQGRVFACKAKSSPFSETARGDYPKPLTIQQGIPLPL